MLQPHFTPWAQSAAPLRPTQRPPRKVKGMPCASPIETNGGLHTARLLFADGGGQCLNWGGVYVLFRVAPEARLESLKWGYHCRLCIFEKGEKY